MTDLFILCRSKAKGNSSAALEQELLARGIDAYRVTSCTPKRRPEDVRCVLSYGVSHMPEWASRLPTGCRWLNDVFTVRLSANKQDTLHTLALAEVPTLNYTSTKRVAADWVASGERVMSRLVLNGCKGKGIVISPPDALPDAPLYTKVFTGPNITEYRVYIVGGLAIDIAQKKRWSAERRQEAGIDHKNPYKGLIRTNGNGWVFARHNLGATPSAITSLLGLAEDCADTMLMGFGVVDILATHTDDGELIDARVVEPNTAPSLVGDRNTRAIMAEHVANYVRGIK